MKPYCGFQFCDHLCFGFALHSMVRICSAAGRVEPSQLPALVLQGWARHRWKVVSKSSVRPEVAVGPGRSAGSFSSSAVRAQFEGAAQTQRRGMCHIQDIPSESSIRRARSQQEERAMFRLLLQVYPKIRNSEGDPLHATWWSQLRRGTGYLV